MSFPHLYARQIRVLALCFAAILSAFVVFERASASSTTEAKDCSVQVSGATAKLSWSDEGGVHVIRRNDQWIATPGKGSTSFTDNEAPASATYVVRTWTNGGYTDRTCAAPEAPPAGLTSNPTPVDPSTSAVEVSGSTAKLSWSDEGGVHVIRRNDQWIATPGKGSASFTDKKAPASATYVVRTWTNGGYTDRTCAAPEAGAPAPAPATTQPAPTTTQPAPTTTQPAPTTTQPAPTTTQPAPTTTQPAPTTTQPAPTTTQPAPTTTVPQPTTTAPPSPAPASNAAACLGVYNGVPLHADQDTFNQFGAYPAVASTYYQPNQRLQIAQETARIQRGTSPNITVTTKGTNRIEALAKGPSHRDYPAARQWLETFVDELAILAAVDSDVPVYATIEHEFKVKIRLGQVTGQSARTDYYGQVLDMFYAMAHKAHPNIRTSYWMAGYDREVEGAVAAQFETLPKAILFDPYASEQRSISDIVAGDVAWIRGQSWYNGQEIALGEFGKRVSSGDKAMASFFTDVGSQLEEHGIAWAVLFNRERDFDTKIVDRSDGKKFPEATKAFSASLKAADDC